MSATKKYIYLAVSIIAVLLLVGACGSYFSYNNREIALRTEAEAQRGKIEGVHDKMWKVLQQKAQITNEYAQSFDSIYTHIIAGRYSQGDGSLMKWIKEANPDFDSSLYKDLMQSVEICRTEFQNSQERMLDIIREHQTLCSQYPGTWFISNKVPIEYEVISSTKSKMVMETGIDDDVDLFKK
jgi:hypothetical protein